MSMEDYSVYETEDPNLEGLERTIFDDVSIDEPWSLIEEFSGLEREAGTRDEREAADYVAGRLDRFGIPYDVHAPELPAAVPKSASLQIRSPPGGSYEYDETDDPRRIKPELFSRTGAVEGEVVRVEKTDSSDLSSAYGGIDVDRDVRDKIVVIEDLPLSIGAKLSLERRGAKGIITVHPHETESSWGRVGTKYWGGVPEPGETLDGSGAVCISVPKPIGDRLTEGDADGEAPVVEISAEVDREWVVSPQVIAEIEGGEEPENDDFVLFHAHLDSWWTGVTDNATGNAALLEIARVINRHADELNRDLRIAWWTGHSQGTYSGSTWWTDENAIDLAENCVAHVNIDGPGGEYATEFTDAPCWMPEGDGLCRAVIEDVTGKDSNENRPVRAGDYSFNNIGVTGLLMVASNVPEAVRNEMGWDYYKDIERYHQPTDTIEKVDEEILVRDVRVYAVLVWRLLSRDVLPLNHVRNVQRHKEIVESLAEQTGDHFDLDPVSSRLEALEESIDELYGAIDRDEVSREAANEAIKRISRGLTRANFANKGQFEQDLTTSCPPYPKLDPATELPELEGDRYRIRVANLKRARNEVVYELKRTNDQVRTYLQ